MFIDSRKSRIRKGCGSWDDGLHNVHIQMAKKLIAQARYVLKKIHLKWRWAETISCYGIMVKNGKTIHQRWFRRAKYD